MAPSDQQVHERWMEAALAFGRRGMGRTAPNPSVAALVVKDGVVLGRGVTAAGGRPHAEPIALAAAGLTARGATLYVTLEPCSHHGHTPPCTEGIIAAGVAQVVYAIGDPDARVAGRGLAQLRDAGIAVVGPVAPRTALHEHRGHILRATHGRPTVTLKLAETADGYAAAPSGHPRLLITGPLANAAVHGMRALHDAVMVGIGTATADDPLLTVRLPGNTARPTRVVLDRQLRLPLTSALVRTAADSPLLVIASETADPERRSALEDQGARVVLVPTVSDETFALEAVLASLGQHGITRVFCEGGPRLAASLVEAGFADEVVLLTGSVPLGAAGIPALSPALRLALQDPARYRLVDDYVVGPDRLRRYDRI